MHRTAARRPATRSASLSSSHPGKPPGSRRDLAGTSASSVPSGMASCALHLIYPAAARDEQHRSVSS